MCKEVDFDQMDFDGLDANFDALNAYDEQLEGLEQELETLVMDIFSCLGHFFLLHLAVGASLNTPSLEIGRVTGQTHDSSRDSTDYSGIPIYKNHFCAQDFDSFLGV